MAWLRPHRVEIRQKRLDALLAESAIVSRRARASAEEVKESVAVEHQALVETIEMTHRRRKARENRAHEKARRDPSLAAVGDVIRILEGRQ